MFNIFLTGLVLVISAFFLMITILFCLSGFFVVSSRKKFLSTVRKFIDPEVKGYVFELGGKGEFIIPRLSAWESKQRWITNYFIARAKTPVRRKLGFPEKQLLIREEKTIRAIIFDPEPIAYSLFEFLNIKHHYHAWRSYSAMHSLLTTCSTPMTESHSNALDGNTDRRLGFDASQRSRALEAFVAVISCALSRAETLSDSSKIRTPDITASINIYRELTLLLETLESKVNNGDLSTYGALKALWVMAQFAAEPKKKNRHEIDPRVFVPVSEFINNKKTVHESLTALQTSITEDPTILELPAEWVFEMNYTDVSKEEERAK